MLERILLKYFIRHDYPVLSPNDTVAKALSAMEVWKVKNLPVVERGEYISLAAEADLSQHASSASVSEALNPSGQPPCIGAGGHIFEALRVMSQNRTSVLPVVNEKGRYKGLITQDAVLYTMSDLLPFDGDASLLVIEMPKRDQSLSALVHLVENNNAHVLYYTTRPLVSGENILAYLIIDLADPSPVMMSLERFNYKLIYHSSRQDAYSLATADRWEELMHYLNI